MTKGIFSTVLPASTSAGITGATQAVNFKMKKSSPIIGLPSFLRFITEQIAARFPRKRIGLEYRLRIFSQFADPSENKPLMAQMISDSEFCTQKSGSYFCDQFLNCFEFG